MNEIKEVKKITVEYDDGSTKIVDNYLAMR